MEEKAATSTKKRERRKKIKWIQIWQSEGMRIKKKINYRESRRVTLRRSRKGRRFRKKMFLFSY